MLTNDQIEHLIDETIRREGGLIFTDHPLDRGGPTFAGITQQTWTNYRNSRADLPLPVRDLTSQHVRAFYRTEHIEPFAWIDDLPLVALLVDSGVHHGLTRAIKWLQHAAGATPDGLIGYETRTYAAAEYDSRHAHRMHREVLKSRLAFIATIVRNDPSQARWLLGWINRVCEFLR